MQITSQSFVITISVVAVLAIIAVPVLWDRWTWRRTFRSVNVLLAAVLALFAGGVLVNTQGDFFPTWSSLVGGDSSGLVAGSDGVQGDLGQVHGRTVVQARLEKYAALTRSGNGVVIREDFAGPRSHIGTRPGAVYIPAAYFRRHSDNLEFPVIELLSGSPGDPAGELRKLRIAQFLDEEIHAHRMPPTIAVIPTTNPSPLRDDECVNAVGGQQDDTYLTTDIRTDMIRDFRVQTGRNAWSLMGYSTGGYCAVNLAVRHPEYYAAAASFSGYFYPITDPTTGNLYHGDKAVRAANSPLQILHREKVQPATAFFLEAGSLEHGPPGQLNQLLGELRTPASGIGIQVPNGGHDWAPWRQELPIALDWIGQRYGGPLAPALRPSHGETVTTATGSTAGPSVHSRHAGGRPTLANHRQSTLDKANVHLPGTDRLGGHTGRLTGHRAGPPTPSGSVAEAGRTRTATHAH
jgi:enterochelin esterase-like enzyme